MECLKVHIKITLKTRCLDAVGLHAVENVNQTYKGLRLNFLQHPAYSVHKILLGCIHVKINLSFMHNALCKHCVFWVVTSQFSVIF